MQPIVRFDLGLGYFSPTDNAARTRQMDGERGYGYGYRKAKQQWAHKIVCGLCSSIPD